MKIKIAGRLAALTIAGLFLASCSEDKVTETAGKKAAETVKVATSAAPVAAPVPVPKNGAGFDSTQKQQIRALIRQTLIENPEILQEAFAALEEKERQVQEKKKTEALALNADTLFRSKLSPTSGDPNGDVTVVEFFDYNCPYCRKAFEALDKVMAVDKKVKVVFKEYPIFGGASQVAAKAALAAKKQGKYYELHKALLTQNQRVTKKLVFKKAEEVGIDLERLKKDMEADDVNASIQETRKLADSLGIRGTPAIFIGDKLIPGAPENLVSLIKATIKDIRKNGCKDC